MSQTAKARMRSVSVAARTVYRELRRSGHGRADLLAFVNELLDQTLDPSEGEDDGPLRQVVDPETGVVSPEVVLSTLDRECARAAADRARCLSIATLALSLPRYVPTDVRARAHRALVACTVDRLRAGDVLGRLDETTYLLVVHAGESSVIDLRDGLRRAARVALPKTNTSPDRPTLAWRHLSVSGTAASSEMLLSECFARTPYELLDGPSMLHRVVAAPVQNSSFVLALGAGAARAAAHAGVLRELARRNIEIAAVAASGGSAVAAAMHAIGMEQSDIVDRFAAFPSTPLYREMRRAYAAYSRKVPRGGPGAAYYRASMLPILTSRKVAALGGTYHADVVRYFVPKDVDIERLRPRLVPCAANLVTGRLVSFTHGSLHAALQAASAFPGIFPPVLTDAGALVDGSTLSEVPVRLAASLAPEAQVLAVVLERPDRVVRTFATASEVSVRSSAIAHAELAREQLRSADIVLPIAVHDVGWLEFGAARDLAGRGASAVERLSHRRLAERAHALVETAYGDPRTGE